MTRPSRPALLTTLEQFVRGQQLDVMRGGRTTNNYGQRNVELRVKRQTSIQKVSSPILLQQLHDQLMIIDDIEDLLIHDTSPNSGRFSSVGFSYGGEAYDIVLADGGNHGHVFENQIIRDLISVVFKNGSNAKALALLDSLEKADTTFNRNSVHYIHDRKGLTHRSFLEPIDTGRVIADVIFEMDDGSDRYVSLKSSTGSTLANFGVGKNIDKQTFEIDMGSRLGYILQSFNVNCGKVAAGLRNYNVDNSPIHHDVMNWRLSLSSDAYDLLVRSWGLNYFYAREIKDGFQTFNVDLKTITSKLLSDLVVTEVRYPYSKSKQLEIKVENDVAAYAIDLRNARGGTNICPTELKVRLTKLNL